MNSPWLYCSAVRINGNRKWKGAVKRNEEILVLCAHKHKLQKEALLCISKLLRSTEKGGMEIAVLEEAKEKAEKFTS